MSSLSESIAKAKKENSQLWSQYPYVKTPVVKYSGDENFPEDYDIIARDVLQWTDLQNNNNKYYSLELHVGLSNGLPVPKFRLFSHYGRADDLASNPNSGRKEVRNYSLLNEAKGAYHYIIYKDKTSAAKGYKKVSLFASNIGSEKARGNSSDDQKNSPIIQTTSNLPKPIQDLIDYIYTEAEDALTATISAKITPKGIETPLGVLSADQVNQGGKILDKIAKSISSGKGDIYSLSNDFYSLIPHKIGRSAQALKDAAIRTIENVDEKKELLQLMEDMVSVSSGGSISSNITDNHYKALRNSIEKLEPFSHDFDQIVDLLNEREKFDFQVVNIFSLSKSNEVQNFTNHIVPSKLLFHGSKIHNFVGLLSRGVLLPKAIEGLGVKRTNFGWLGAGVYFGDSMRTTSIYATPGNKGTRLMLVCKVALGNIQSYTKIQPELNSPPAGFNSVLGDSDAFGSDFSENEYVIYDKNQQMQMYLVEFTANNEAAKQALQEKELSTKGNPISNIKQDFNSGFKKQQEPSPFNQVQSKRKETVENFDSPVAVLSDSISKDQEKENHFREIFANNRDSFEVSDNYVGLIDVFKNLNDFKFADEDFQEKKIPKVLTVQKQANSNISIGNLAIVNNDQFLKNWNEFTQNQFFGLNWDNIFVAGGAVLGPLIESDPISNENSFKSSDIDLFVYGLTENQASLKIKEIYEIVYENIKKNAGDFFNEDQIEIIRTKHAVTIINQYPYRHVQIILRLYKSPAEILMGFDVDCCAIGFDGKKVYCCPRTRRAICKRYNLVDMTRRSLTYEVRLYKYSKRGFSVAVPGFDRSKVDKIIFSKNLGDLKGLSKLLWFEYCSLKNQKPFTKPTGYQGIQKKAYLDDSFTDDKITEFEANRQEESDYSEVFIPWGPQWYSHQIIKLIDYKNKTQVNGCLKEHIYTSGIDSVLNGKQNNISFNNPNDPMFQPLKWLSENPGRQLLTGSFHPVNDDEWDKQAYGEYFFSGNSNYSSELSHDHYLQYNNSINLVKSNNNNNNYNQQKSKINLNSPSKSATISEICNAAFSKNDRKLLEYFQNSTANINQKDEKGWTALCYACCQSSFDCVTTLVEHGASPFDQENICGNYPLHLSAYSGNQQILSYLLNNGANCLDLNNNSQTALHLSCYYNQPECTRILLEKNSNASTFQDSKGRTPFHMAGLSGSTECLNLLISSNSNYYSEILTKVDFSNESPVSLASYRGHDSFVNNYSKHCKEFSTSGDVHPDIENFGKPQYYLESYEDNFVDSNGVTPLHVFAMHDDSSNLSSLLQQNSSKVNTTDNQGQSPLHYAARFGSYLVANMLLDANVDLNAKNNRQQTALYYAKETLDQFSDFPDVDGYTNLLTPNIKEGIEKIINLLFNYGAESPNLSTYNLPPFDSPQPVSRISLSPSKSKPVLKSRPFNFVSPQKDIQQESDIYGGIYTGNTPTLQEFGSGSGAFEFASTPESSPSKVYASPSKDFGPQSTLNFDSPKVFNNIKNSPGLGPQPGLSVSDEGVSVYQNKVKQQLFKEDINIQEPFRHSDSELFGIGSQPGLSQSVDFGEVGILGPQPKTQQNVNNISVSNSLKVNLDGSWDSSLFSQNFGVQPGSVSQNSDNIEARPQPSSYFQSPLVGNKQQKYNVPQPSVGQNLSPKKSQQTTEDLVEKYSKPLASYPPPSENLKSGSQHIELLKSQALGFVASKPPQSAISKMLLLNSLCFKGGKITEEEKIIIKDLILKQSQAVRSACEVFEVELDLDELSDTFKKIVEISLAR